MTAWASPSGPRMAMPSAAADRGCARRRRRRGSGRGRCAPRRSRRRGGRPRRRPAASSTPTTSVWRCTRRATKRAEVLAAARARDGPGARRPGAVGLSTAACSRVGTPTGHIEPSATVARVSATASPRHSTSTPPARTASSTPQERISSIERRLTTVARGSDDSSARRSTSIVSTPSRASEMAAASPAGPAPAMTHGRCLRYARWLVSLFRRTVVSFIRHHVKRICCVTMATRRYEQRLRAQPADETRRRVLDAVYDRLRAAPAQPVSVDRIARAAGVARSTVYLIFGSRAGLFDAFAADLLERGGFQPRARGRRRSRPARDHARGDHRRRPDVRRPPRRLPRARLDGGARPGGRRRRDAAQRGATGQGDDAARAAAGRARPPPRRPHRRGRPPTGSGF